ncbi:MAG: hypothetical protein DPW15_07800, partial [Chloroflexi bacterium]|nr:hypothetical protein [Chloroflexota bacterium]
QRLSAPPLKPPSCAKPPVGGGGLRGKSRAEDGAGSRLPDMFCMHTAHYRPMEEGGWSGILSKKG